MVKKSKEVKGGVKKVKARDKLTKAANSDELPTSGKTKSSSDKKEKNAVVPAAKDEPKSQPAKKLKVSEEIDGLFGQLKGGAKKPKVGGDNIHIFT